MADILSEGVVQRTDIVPYMNTGTEESPKWSQMGAGWTKFSESPNAQTKSKKYINEKTDDKIAWSEVKGIFKDCAAILNSPICLSLFLKQ